MRIWCINMYRVYFKTIIPLLTANGYAFNLCYKTSFFILDNEPIKEMLLCFFMYMILIYFLRVDKIHVCGLKHDITIQIRHCLRYNSFDDMYICNLCNRSSKLFVQVNTICKSFEIYKEFIVLVVKKFILKLTHPHQSLLNMRLFARIKRQVENDYFIIKVLSV